jgi:DNA-binding GntR family transcriptional regulator
MSTAEHRSGRVLRTPPPSPSRERFERLYRALRDRICLFEYPPGGRLSEEELAKEFAISRTPVRRVLGRLEADGLIEARHGVGHIVALVPMEELAQTYQLRMELAVLIGRLSPIPPGQGNLDRIRALIARCAALPERPVFKDLAQINMEFFSEINAMTGNGAVREINERLYYQTARAWVQQAPRLDLAEEFAVFRREMEDVLAAADAGDLEAVGHIRGAHISMSFARMRRYARDPGAGPASERAVD